MNYILFEMVEYYYMQWYYNGTDNGKPAELIVHVQYTDLGSLKHRR